MRWFLDLVRTQPHQRPLEQQADQVAVIRAQQDKVRSEGSIAGRHHTDYVERVKQLKREGRHSEAIDLLLQLIDATEGESRAAGDGWGVAPWYYEQLAIIYRKDRR